MAKMKMDFYVNIQIREGSRHYSKAEPIKSCGIRHGTFYMDGDPSKVVSQSDIVAVYVIKDGTYKKVDLDTFVALYRAQAKA